MRNSAKHKVWYWVVAAMAVALAILFAGGVWYYRSEQQLVRKKAIETLASIGQLKAAEIAGWRSERLGDAAVLADNPFFREAARRFLTAPDEQNAQRLRAFFDSLKTHYHYADILLVDAQGQECLSQSGKKGEHRKYIEMFAASKQARKPLLGELHTEQHNSVPHISAMAPIFSDNSPGLPLLCAVVLISDASSFLYPLINAWPTSSQSAETLLVCREGDQVLFLNELRHRPSSALELRIPLGRTDVPAVMAVLGRQGVVEGSDYRGIPVVSYLLPVPDSPWFLIAKQDAAEIYAEWRARRILILSVLGALACVVVVAGAGVLYRVQKAYYKTLYDSAARLSASMQRQSITLKSIGDAVIATDVHGNVEMLNPEAEKLTGWTDAEAHGKPLGEVFHIINEMTRQAVGNPVAKVLLEGSVVGLANHTLLIAKDGTERPIADSAAPIFDAQNQTVGVVLVFRDQTTEQNYMALFQKMLDGFAVHKIICDTAGNPVDYQFQAVNPAFERMTGLKACDTLGKTILQILPRTERHWIETYGKVALTGAPAHFESYSEELKKYFYVTAFRPAINQFATIFQDITERKGMENALKESEKRYRSLTDDVLDHTKVGIFILNSDFKVVWVNHALEKFFGFQRAAVIGKDKRQLIRDKIAGIFEDSESFASKVLATYDNNTYMEKFECHVLPAEGREERWLQHWSQPIQSGLYAGGRVEYYYEITELKKAEAEQKRLVAAIEQGGEIVIVTDQKGKIQYVNEAFEAVTGYTRHEALGQTPRFLKSGVHDKAFFHAMWSVLEKGKVFRGRLVNKRKDGTCFTEEISIAPVCDDAGRIVNYVAVSRDITERLQMEAELQQAQKMESVGRLAGGVAHDFNNMLGAILGNAELALDSLEPSAPQRSELEEIISAAKRSAEITQQLLAFARKQVVVPRVLDLNETINGMIKMLRRLVSENVALKWEPGVGPFTVKIDPSQIHQLLTNLCANARDAIRDVGTVTIRTGLANFDGEDCANGAGVVAGDFVMLTVSDDGCGMDPETVSHLFEPFFTTKEIGRGTGLGLATVHGVVRQNNGFIRVQSTFGIGTDFKIYLPRHSGHVEEAPAEQGGAVRQSQGETVLIVEDEGAILRLSRSMLEKMGYTVLTATTPDEALLLADDYAGTIHLLLSDVVMPGMNGRDLANRLKRDNPELKCLFMSGYTANVIAHHGVLDRGIFFIQKPFTRQALAHHLEMVLGRGEFSSDLG